MNAQTGDSIRAKGQTITIKRILYQDCKRVGEYDVEFVDNHEKYHHWKQNQDGGILIQKS